MSDSGPRSVERFFSPPSPVIEREYEKTLCACVLFCVCFFLSDWKCVNCNSICPVFLRTSMRWRFSLLIGLVEVRSCELLSYEISGQGSSRLLSRADSTEGCFLWLFYASDSSHLQNSTFHFLHFLVAKDIQDSLVSKRWKYSTGIKSKLFIRIAIKTCWIRRPLTRKLNSIVQ